MKGKALVAMLVTVVLLVVSSVMFAHHTSAGLFDAKGGHAALKRLADVMVANNAKRVVQ